MCNFVDEIIVTHGEDSTMTKLLQEKGIQKSDGLSKKFKKRVETLQKTNTKNVKDLIKQFNVVGLKGTEY